MTIHFLVEGPSEREFLEPWMHRLLKGHPVRVHPREGKGRLPSDLNARPDPRRRGLLDQLPVKLRGFASAAGVYGDGVVVLLDADDDDPAKLKAAIEHAAATVAPGLRVLVHVAVEEVEAFYLGDLRAIERAYPDADMKLAAKYVPDSICGTWEYFGRVIHDDGGNKLAWAETMGPKVTTAPGSSRSPSFRALIAALLTIAPRRPAGKKKRNYRHIARTDKRRAER